MIGVGWAFGGCWALLSMNKDLEIWTACDRVRISDTQAQENGGESLHNSGLYVVSAAHTTATDPF